jgi:hypothetical protein
MIFLKRRAFMTFKFNYETSKGIKQVILTNCGQAPFKQFSILGNSHQNSTAGKQLFDAKTIVRDMVIELDGSLVSGKEYFTSDFIKVDPSTTYFVNATGSKRGKYFDENKKVMFTSSFSDFNPENGAIITTPEKAYYIRFSGLIGNIETIMLNKGSSATPYEPYTGGKPSPSPDYPQEIKNVGKWNEETQKYEVDVKVTGKNLFDIDSFLKLPLQPVSGNDDVRKLILTLKPNTKYTLSTNNEGTCNSQDKDTSRSLYFTNADDEIYQCNTTVVFKGKKVTVTSDENGRVKIVLFDRTNSKPIENKQCYVMLNEGTFAEPYEPYFPEQTATITMDEPLRGIGKYQDKITKDGIARRIRSVMLNGNEDWKLYGSNGNINNFGYILREAISNNVGQRSSLTFSSYKSGVWATDRLGQDMFARIIRINLPKDVFPDVETLRNWLSQSKTTLQYVLEKEVIVPISQSEQDAIRALTTYHPTTVITVDGGDVDAGIEVEYAVKNKEKI